MSNTNPEGPLDRHTLRLRDLSALQAAKELEARLREEGKLSTVRIGSAYWTTNNPDFIATSLKINSQAQIGRAASAMRTKNTTGGAKCSEKNTQQ